MGGKYKILAAKYPYQGYWEESSFCDSFEEAIKQVEEYHQNGYNIIDLYCRDFENEKEI